MDKIVVQSDWNIEQSQFWVSFRAAASSQAVHSHFKCVRGDDGKPLLRANDRRFTAVRTQSQLDVHFTDGAVKCSSQFVAPDFEYRLHGDHPVSCLAVSNGGLAASVGSDSPQIIVWSVHDGFVKRRFDGHHLDVTVVEFFPSGLVLLSGSLDMTLRIWSLENGTCVRQLLGHTMGIMDVSFIDKGAQVVSTSRDATCKVWNCAHAKVDSECSPEHGELTACVVNSNIQNAKDGINIAIGCSDGNVINWSPSSPEEISPITKCAATVTCMAMLQTDTETTLVIGTEDGRIIIPQRSYVRHELVRGAVTSISSIRMSFVAAFADGTAICVKLINADKVKELTGSDCDRLTAVCVTEGMIVTASNDSVIRVYNSCDMLS